MQIPLAEIPSGVFAFNIKNVSIRRAGESRGTLRASSTPQGRLGQGKPARMTLEQGNPYRNPNGMADAPTGL